MQHNPFKREQLFATLNTTTGPWDIIIIGGGASGLGVALDAVSRCYKTLLLEQSDFAKGTSSRSTKLVHGGVRYLAQGQFRLVREASIERGLLLRNAAHLVKNQAFIVPVYSLWDQIKYTAGLKLYDLLAGRLSLGPSVFISRKETMEKMPGIRTDHLRGGVLYHDGQFDDSRLALNLAQTVIEKGGLALNYMQVTGLVTNLEGHICGVKAKDLESGQNFELRAGAVVNATGVFVDDILMMDPSGPREKRISVSQGVHVVVDRSFYPSTDALMIPKTSDGRVLFAVPWHQKVVLGTTDTPVQAASLEPRALDKEIDFILSTAGHYLEKIPQRKDVLSVFAGLRPLAAPRKDTQKTKEISRSHKILVSPSRLFTLLGGKWTTYRKMGEDMIDRVEREMNWPHKATHTASLPLHGSAPATNWDDPLYFYGTDKPALEVKINGTAGNWLSEKLKIHKEQVQWAVEYEMARTVEDVLARRTRGLLLDARESKRIAPEVAALMAAVLGKDEEWIQEQTNRFCRLADQYIL